MTEPFANPDPHARLTQPLVVLTPAAIHQIDSCLARVGAFGEVRLVVAKGRLRFIQVLQSESLSDNQARGMPE